MLRAIPHILCATVALSVCALSWRPEIEARFFPVITHKTAELIDRTPTTVHFRYGFHKARNGVGAYSAWAVTNDGNRYLVMPRHCETGEWLQGGITARGTEGQYDFCLEIPKIMQHQEFTLTSVFFYQVWHGGIVPTYFTPLKIPALAED